MSGPGGLWYGGCLLPGECEYPSMQLGRHQWTVFALYSNILRLWNTVNSKNIGLL